MPNIDRATRLAAVRYIDLRYSHLESGAKRDRKKNTCAALALLSDQQRAEYRHKVRSFLERHVGLVAQAKKDTEAIVSQRENADTVAMVAMDHNKLAQMVMEAGGDVRAVRDRLAQEG